MGIDPTFPKYFIGDDCNQCNVAAFNEQTPEFIMAVVSGVTTCPAAAQEFPNGAHLLQQSGIFPCRWSIGFGIIGISLTLEGGVALFRITGFGTEFYFVDQKPDPCVFSFQNDIIDCTLGDWGFGGVAFLFWGPGIGPQIMAGFDNMFDTIANDFRVSALPKTWYEDEFNTPETKTIRFAKRSNHTGVLIKVNLAEYYAFVNGT